jgi:hypothetical protein
MRPLLALVVLASSACGAQAATGPAGVEDPAIAAADADAGDCGVRARVRPVCLQAVAARCRGQAQTCESTCEAQFGSMPGNSEKEPGLRGDIESSQCRARCGNDYPACTRSLASRCPETCAPP